jgi:hypothetical protein
MGEVAMEALRGVSTINRTTRIALKELDLIQPPGWVRIVWSGQIAFHNVDRRC